MNLNVTVDFTFVNNKAVFGREDYYTEISIDVARILENWKESLYSFEWLSPDGRIKALKELPEQEQAKRIVIEDIISKGEALEKPVLGIGLLENVEIGIGKPTLLTLAAFGATTVPVHIPINSIDDFAPFRAE